MPYLNEGSEVVPLGSSVAAAPFAVHHGSEPLDRMTSLRAVEHISAGWPDVHYYICKTSLSGKGEVPLNVFFGVGEIREVCHRVNPDVKSLFLLFGAGA